MSRLYTLSLTVVLAAGCAEERIEGVKSMANLVQGVWAGWGNGFYFRYAFFIKIAYFVA